MSKLSSIISKVIIFTLISTDIILIIYLLIHGKSFPVFEPAGIIASKERTLMIMVFSLAAIIGVFVLSAAYFIFWRFGEQNTKAKYSPELSENKLLEKIWWIIPSIIILFLSILTWVSTHDLDPTKAIATTAKPMTIQVVALQWKWLFIYPEQNIATVNTLVIPVKRPITFELTADAPMNSFWIPQLGGQLYAMSGMVNKLHLMADTPGEFWGSNAEISGAGFAGMRFPVKATTQEGFESWVQTVKQSPKTLTHEEYTKLAIPSENTPATLYSSVEKNLYNGIVMKFMKAPTASSGSISGEGSSSTPLEKTDQNREQQMPGM